MLRLIRVLLLSVLLCAMVVTIEVAMSRYKYLQRKQRVNELTAVADQYRRTRTPADINILIDALGSSDAHTRSTAAALLRQLGLLASPAVVIPLSLHLMMMIDISNVNLCSHSARLARRPQMRRHC